MVSNEKDLKNQKKPKQNVNPTTTQTLGIEIIINPTLSQTKFTPSIDTKVIMWRTINTYDKMVKRT